MVVSSSTFYVLKGDSIHSHERLGWLGHGVRKMCGEFALPASSYLKPAYLDHSSCAKCCYNSGTWGAAIGCVSNLFFVQLCFPCISTVISNCAWFKSCRTWESTESSIIRGPSERSR